MLSPMLLFLLAFSASLTILQGAPVATCRSVGIAPERTWRFERVDERWQVVHWMGDLERNAVPLRLPPTASVRLSETEVTVKGRTSNGGIDVSLTGQPARATLDIYVSYELEVNVDTSLTPAIDDLNTDGPIGVRCEIVQR